MAGCSVAGLHTPRVPGLARMYILSVCRAWRVCVHGDLAHMTSYFVSHSPSLPPTAALVFLPLRPASARAFPVSACVSLRALRAADVCASLCKESAEWPAVVMGTTNLSAPLPTCKLYRWTEGSINCGVSGYKTVSRAGQGWA